MAEKLAKLIRSGDFSDQDLAHFDKLQVADLVPLSFTDPIETAEPVRITFIVGGGKKVRTAYGGPDGLLRDMCLALDKIGYREDRGASASLDCMGCYKSQHDTDKNLIFVHVIPRVTIVKSGPAEGGGEEGDGPVSVTQQLLEMTVEKLTALAPKKLCSFGQRQKTLKMLKDASSTISQAEAKMTEMKPLTDSEQALYDVAVAVPEKISWLQTSMQQMIDAGQLTRSEKQSVLDQMDAKMEEAAKALEAARAEGNEGKVKKLEAAVEALKTKRAAVAGAQPIVLPFKFENELRKLTKTLNELKAIESCKQMQSIETIQRLNEKPSVEGAIREIEEANRGWFEDEVEFQDRIKAVLSKAGGSGGGKASASGGNTGGFSAAKGGGGSKGAKPASTGFSSANKWALLQDN